MIGGLNGTETGTFSHSSLWIKTFRDAVLRGCSMAEGVNAQSPRHGNELIRDQEKKTRNQLIFCCYCKIQ